MSKYWKFNFSKWPSAAILDYKNVNPLYFVTRGYELSYKMLAFRQFQDLANIVNCATGLSQNDRHLGLDAILNVLWPFFTLALFLNRLIMKKYI